jgi:hypothetical protein
MVDLRPLTSFPFYDSMHRIGFNGTQVPMSPKLSGFLMRLFENMVPG